jgi:hypothetical protein
MKLPAEQLLPQALSAFTWPGLVVGTARYGAGHINDTFCVYVQTDDGDCVRFILQRINTNTFRDPAALMENICGVTEHLRKKIEAAGGDVMRETMNVIPTRDGKPYYADEDGGAWRVYTFVEGTVCLQKVEQPQQFYESAWAFGNFQRLLADYPAATLHETIANFHHTVRRYEAFERALAADACGRAAEVAEEVAFVQAHKDDCAYMVNLLEQGKLPLRVTHNDTKLNNILMDKATGKGLCVIDLDTVMPGLAANDFGDSIRFGANHCAEDEPDLSKVNFSLPLFETYTQGFLGAAGDALTPLEKETLPWGAKLMTLECGIRFLTDYLEGDHYFKIHHPQQNLHRCRTQFKLVRDMEAQWDAMADVVKKYS